MMGGSFIEYMNAFDFRNAPGYDAGAIMLVPPVAYWLLVWQGIGFMRSRTAVNVKALSVVHSFGLCALSVVMFLGLGWGALRQASEDGAWTLFCDDAPSQDGVRAFWMYVYWLSKFPELLDTAILVLRKKPVIFLHVFHHGIMTLMPYLWLRGNWTVTWFGCFLNCFIHIWMYLHYAMSAALGPKRWNPWWKRHLTGLQIVQFVLVFLIICLFVATIRIVGTPCQGDLSIVWTSQAVNLVFLFFFVKFFIDAYGAKKKANTKKKE